MEFVLNYWWIWIIGIVLGPIGFLFSVMWWSILSNEFSPSHWIIVAFSSTIITSIIGIASTVLLFVSVVLQIVKMLGG